MTSQILHGLVLAVLVGASLAIGGVHPISVGVLSVVVALGLVLVTRYDDGSRERLPFVVWALVGAALLSLFQTLPLGGAAQAVSPAVATLWTDLELTAHLSANLPASWLAACRMGLWAGLLTLAFRIYRHPLNAFRLLDAVIVLAAGLAVMALVQLWIDPSRVLFFYEPRNNLVRGGLRGPFVNPSHLGAVLMLGALLAFGRGFGLALHRRRYLYYFAFVVCGTGLVLTWSLTALLGLAFGIAAISWGWRRRDKRAGEVIALAVPLFGVVLANAAGTVFLGFVPMPIEAISAQITELKALPEAWRAGVSVLTQAWPFGVGAGSTGDLLPILGGYTAPARVSFMRSEPLQWLLDFGVVGAGVLLSGFLLALRRLSRGLVGERHEVVLPVWGASIGFVAVGLVGFAPQITAVGALAVVILGTGLAGTARSHGSRGRAPGVVLGTWVAAAALVATALLAVFSSKSQDDLEAQLVRQYETHHEPAGTVETALEYLRRRPAAGAAFRFVGAAYLRAGEPEVAVGWLDRAVVLLPADGVSWRLLGAAHLAMGTEREGLAALIEAVRVDETQRRGAMAQLLAANTGATGWVAFMREASGDTPSYVFDFLLRAPAPDLALRVAAQCLVDQPDDPIALGGAADAALALSEDQMARRFAEQLAQQHAGHATTERILALLDARAGDVGSAIDRLLHAVRQAEDHTELWLLLAQLLLIEAEEDNPRDVFEARFLEAREHLRTRALAHGREARAFRELSARFYLITGQYRAALSSAESGIQEAPSSASFYAIAAIAQAQLEHVESALARLEEARRLAPTSLWTRRAEQVFEGLGLALPTGSADTQGLAPSEEGTGESVPDGVGQDLEFDRENPGGDTGDAYE